MKLIFDIGANSGRTIDIFKNKCEKVIAFEPNPELIKFLQDKYKNQNVIIDSRGVSNHNGTQIFRIANIDTISTFSDDWINKSRFTNDWSWNSGIVVETVTLESIINEYGIPDYIKIDIEGYEYEVLINFNRLIPNTIFAFEWAEEQKYKIEQILNHIKNLNYNCFYFTFADTVLFEDEINWVTFENLNLIQDLVSERKDKWGMIYFKYLP